MPLAFPQPLWELRFLQSLWERYTLTNLASGNTLDHLIFVKLACIPNFSFLGELEDTCPGWVDSWVGLTVIIKLVSVLN